MSGRSTLRLDECPEYVAYHLAGHGEVAILCHTYSTYSSPRFYQLAFDSQPLVFRPIVSLPLSIAPTNDVYLDNGGRSERLLDSALTHGVNAWELVSVPDHSSMALVGGGELMVAAHGRTITDSEHVFWLRFVGDPEIVVPCLRIPSSLLEDHDCDCAGSDSFEGVDL